MKRCRATLQIGGERQTLKLGRKKCSALMRSTSTNLGGHQVFDYMSPAHGIASWAVPVADSRTLVKTDVGDA